MNALLAASRVLVMWAGQAALLSLISMFRGRSPQIGKSFQIAVWASLPLALMLIFRYAYFATGGDGGALGLSLLLENESIFSDMPELIQRMVVILFSNFTFFWLWSLFLLYLGARYALGGRRFIVMPVIAMWIIGATLIPALLAEPTNEITPRETVTASVSTADESSSSASNNTTTTQTEQQVFPGNNFGGGNFGGTTGGPGGGGPPG